MRKQVLVFLLALLAMQTSAQKIHWLLFIDTKDTAVGQLDINGREFLRTNFVDIVNAALNESNIQSKVYDYYGDNCLPQKCVKTIKELDCSNKDIVIFYYIGHGGRSVRESDDEHPWPKMWLGQDNPNYMVDLGWVHDQLKAKNPRLLLTIGMCCNVKQNLPLGRIPRFAVQRYGDRYTPPEQLELIRKVFLNTCGDLIATSASPGESSAGGEFNESLGIKPMDYYTGALCLNFLDALEHNDLDFVSLFNKTGGIIHRDSDGKQTPFFRENLKICNGNISVGDCSPIPNKIDVHDIMEIENLLEAIICNRKDMPMRNRFFHTDGKVKILSHNGKTQVDELSIDKYMLRLVTSRILLRVVPIDTEIQNDKIKTLYVREYYKERR